MAGRIDGGSACRGKGVSLAGWAKVKAGFDLVVDDRGRTLQVGTGEVNRILALPEVDGNVENYLVRNLGFVRVRTSGNNLIVTLKPLTVSRKTFEAVSWIIIKNDPYRVALQTYEKTAKYELIADSEEAVIRFSDLCFGVEAELRNAYTSEQLSLDRLEQGRLAPFRELVDTWTACGGRLRANSSDLVQQIAPGGRFMLVRMGAGDPVIQAIQGYNRLYGPTWSQKMAGRYVEDQPDPEYGRFVADAFRQAATEEKPRLELIDATVRESGSISRRFRYERLLLPWRSANTAYVTSSSVVRTSLLSSSATSA